VAFDAQSLMIEPNAPLRVRARVRAEGASAPTLHILQGEQHIRSQSFTSAGAPGAGRYETLVSGLDSGDYWLRIEHPQGQDLAPLPLRVEPNVEAEMRVLSGDEQRLASIASASGGELVRLEEIDQLPAKLQAARSRRSRVVEYSLWDSWQLYVFVLGCLGTEWALRKRFGLA
jgi:hypothetical protein